MFIYHKLNVNISIYLYLRNASTISHMQIGSIKRQRGSIRAGESSFDCRSKDGEVDLKVVINTLQEYLYSRCR